MSASGSSGNSAFLQATNLTKRFGYVTALDEVDLSVDRGEAVAVLGPNGAGKSTLLRTVATLTRPTGGRVTLAGVDVAEHSGIRNRIGLFGHDTMLYDELTARENVILHARLHGVADPTARSMELIDRVGLRARASERPTRFSHGLRKRLSLARALVHDPDLLLLDEPHSGLDRRSGERFGEILNAVSGRTVLLSTHDLAVATRYADRAIFFDRGRRRGTVELADDHGEAHLEDRYESAIYGANE